MWLVQTEGMEKGSAVGSGLICRGGGFSDSPDSEFISGGKSTKYSNNVAIGRHANFFHWGFSGSPRYMTEQAKQVFINSIFYIAKFKGKTPIVRKINPGVWTQSNIRITKENADYNIKLKYSNKNVRFVNEQIKSAKKKLEEGLELNSLESYYMNRPLQKEISLSEFMKIEEPKLFDKFGLDFSKYHAYYDKLIPYMRFNPDNIYYPIIDEDAKKCGVSFINDNFLDKCIKALKKSDTHDLALLLLKRYTTESFSTYKEWKKWYSKNKKKFFFTEAGGAKWMINPN